MQQMYANIYDWYIVLMTYDETNIAALYFLSAILSVMIFVVVVVFFLLIRDIQSQ